LRLENELYDEGHSNLTLLQVYVGQVECDPSLAAARNVHKRSKLDVLAIADGWEETPKHFARVDFRGLLQDDEIQEVAMEESGKDGSQVRRRGATTPTKCKHIPIITL